MFFNTDSMRGPGMIILQVLRGLTIIGLASAVAASWILIVKINTSNGFFFFDAASLFFTSTISVFLAISEVGVAKAYFRRTWPVLSDGHGLTWLGVAMLLIGCNILGKLNQKANSSKKLGLPFWRLVLAGGILCLTFGFMNIILSLILRDGKTGINARNIRANGSLASSSTAHDTFTDHYSERSNSLKGDEKPKAAFLSRFWKKNPDTATGSVRRPQISHPQAVDPPRPHIDIEHNAGFDHHRYDDDQFSEDDRRSPIAPDVRRPDTALHPMNTRYSKYSEAHMSRF